MAIDTVAVIGRGALGLLFGEWLGAQMAPGAVQFVMDDARFAEKGAQRLLVNGEPARVPVVPASQAHPVNLVLLAIKTTGLDLALDTMEGLMGPGTTVLSVCNGVTSEERVAERFGWQGVPLAVAQGMDAVFMGGELTYRQRGEIRLGPATGTAPWVVPKLDAFLTAMDVPHAVEKDIDHRLWTKWMLNVGVNQTCAAFGGTYGSVSAPGEQNRVFVGAMREALACARAEGHDVTERDLTAMAQLMASLTPDGMPSMAQDRLNGKRTEVEEFGGTVLRLAERHGLLVPTNAWLVERIEG